MYGVYFNPFPFDYTHILFLSPLADFGFYTFPIVVKVTVVRISLILAKPAVSYVTHRKSGTVLSVRKNIKVSVRLKSPRERGSRRRTRVPRRAVYNNNRRLFPGRIRIGFISFGIIERDRNILTIALRIIFHTVSLWFFFSPTLNRSIL